MDYSQNDQYYYKAKQYKAMYEEELADIAKLIRFTDVYYDETGVKNDGIVRFSN